MARIIASENGSLKSTYYAIHEALYIGSAANNNVQIVDPSISKIHARISIEIDPQGHQLYIFEDLNSQYGSYLNRHKVVRQALKHQDQIRIGHQQFTFFNYKELISAKLSDKTSR